jgi:hypothetical protein
VQYEFNHFVLKELIDSSSLDDEDNFYLEATNMIAKELLNEPLSLWVSLWVSLDTKLWSVKGFRGTTYCIKIISQITLYLA